MPTLCRCARISYKIIFIGHVERYAYTNKPTLLFCRGKYMRGEPLLPP